MQELLKKLDSLPKQKRFDVICIMLGCMGLSDEEFKRNLAERLGI